MKKSTHKRRSLVITTVLAAAAVGYVVFIFLPKQKAIGELQAELIQKQEYILQAGQRTSALAKTQAELGEADVFVASWKEETTSSNKLHGEIEDDAYAAEAVASLIDPQPTVEMETVSQEPVVIAIEGTFDEIFDFVANTEARPATIWMDGLTVRQTDPEIVWGVFPVEKQRCEMTLLIFADKGDFSE